MAGHPLKTIGFDARMYGLEHAGIGRYVMNLLDRIIGADLLVKWVIFTNPHHQTEFGGRNIQVVSTSIRHYSLAEQTEFLSLLNRQQLDLLHVPHFNVPLLYSRPFLVTIHDILWHQVRGGSVTTLPPPLYYAKYLGYRLTVRKAAFQSKAILVPSGYVKDSLLNAYPGLPVRKIHITYEGVDNIIRPQPTKTPRPNLVYIGSTYPHKNLSTLLKALQLVRLKQPEFTLTIVSSRSVFLEQVKAEVDALGLSSAVVFAGFLSDQKTQELLATSLALVHPSVSEGFGLTGLEAMATGTPVIAAQASALPEVYGDAALFFKPYNATELAYRIESLLSDPRKRHIMIERGIKQAEKYSWDKMADQTIEVYRELCGV